MKLAIFIPNWVGDACMAIPALRALRSGCARKVKLIGVSRPGPAHLLREQNWIDEWLVYKPHGRSPLLNRRRLVVELQRMKCDSALLMTNSLSSAVLAAASRIPRRIGYSRDSRSWLLTDRIKLLTSGGRSLPVPAIDYYLRLAEYMGCPSVDRDMQLSIDPKYEVQADQLWRAIGFHESRKTIVINNNAASANERLWPEESVLRLANKLVRTLDVQVLLHCGPSEVEGTNRIAQKANHDRIRSMGCSSELPIGLSLAVFARAETIVTTDSGARHLAVAMNRPVVTLFGPTQPVWTTTYNIPEIHVQSPFACNACRRRAKHKNGSGTKCDCMKHISPEQVFVAILNQLKSANGFSALDAA